MQNLHSLLLLKSDKTSNFSIYIGLGWLQNTFTINDINSLNPDQLTFTVRHKILQIWSLSAEIIYQPAIINYQKKYKLKATMKKNDFNRYTSSNIVKEMFCFEYDSNDNELILKLCGLPKKLSKIDAVCKLMIKEIDLKFTDIFTDFGYGDHEQSGSMELSGFDPNDYNEIDDFTFLVDIEILNEYDNDGNIIDCGAENEWNKYIRNEATKAVAKAWQFSDVFQKQIKDASEAFNQEADNDTLDDIWTFSMDDQKDEDSTSNEFKPGSSGFAKFGWKAQDDVSPKPWPVFKFDTSQDSKIDECDDTNINGWKKSWFMSILRYMIKGAGTVETECKQGVNERVERNVFQPYCEHFKRKTFYYQHFGVGNYENKSNEELQFEDIYGDSVIRNEMSKNSEGHSYWPPVHQFLSEVLNDHN